MIAVVNRSTATTVPAHWPSAVVFDLGGVLLDWDPRHLYRKLFDDECEMEEFLARICTVDWHRQHDLGADVPESCRELASRYPDHADMIMAWADRGEEMVAGEIAEGVAVLAAIKRAGLRCYALSNMERSTYLVRRDRFGFLGWFDGQVISGFEGVAKPDPRIFAIMLHRYGLAPEATVFIDDSESNVRAAAEVGMASVHYVGAAKLRADLRTLGVPLHDGAAAPRLTAGDQPRIHHDLDG